MTRDKRAFLKRGLEDSLAYRILEKMSLRIRDLGEELSRLKRGQPSHGTYDRPGHVTR